MKTKNILWVMLSAVALLLIPLVAMQFSNEVNWTGLDFVVAWILLTVLGFGAMMVFNKTNTRAVRVTGGIVIILMLWLWIELATGLFTNWGS